MAEGQRRHAVPTVRQGCRQVDSDPPAGADLSIPQPGIEVASG
jgi:hypothetical protein